MRRRILLLTVALCSCLVSVNAIGNIKVNGYEVIKKVKEITFDDTYVLLKWNDNTTSQDLFVRTMFHIANNDDINNLDIFSVCGLQGDKMTVEGFSMGSVIYIYDLVGRLVKKQIVDRPRAVVALDALNTGVYILKNRNTYMRFTKG